MTEADIEQLRHSFYRVLDGQDEEGLRKLGNAIAERAGEDLTAFHAALNALGFHNRLALINEMMARAWERVQSEPTYSHAAVQAYAARAADHLIYSYLEEQSEPFPLKDTLIRRLERYFAVDSQRLQSYLQLLAGRMGRQWSRADFTELKMQSLSGLLVEFLGFGSQAGLNYGLGHLVRELMPRYLMDRQVGNLKPRPDMAEALRQGRRPIPSSVQEPYHPLIPDEETLELFLRRLLGTVHPQPYAAAALLMLTPSWSSFLVARGLVSPETIHFETADVERLRQQLSPFWDQHPDQSLASFAVLHE